MRSAEFLLFLLIAVAVLVTIARRLGVAYPIFLVLGGLALGVVPQLPHLRVGPDLIFVLVLPPIVYFASFFTPLRTLRANITNVASLAVGLVIASALAVAAVAHALVPGISWPVAFLLGTITSTSDAVAVTQVAARFAVPRRMLGILEGESLLNDATGVTLYRVALLGVLAASFSFAAAVGTFVVSSIGGIAVGLIVGWLIALVRRRISDTSVELTVGLLTPYAAFLPAEALNVSGVMATVVAGMYLGSRWSRISNADTRLAGRAVWEMLVFLLNGFVFILTGLEVAYVLGKVAPSDIGRLIAIGAAITISLVAVRALWIFATAYLPRWGRRRKAERYLLGQSLVVSWAGLRGVVSLAVVLALPQTLPSGAPFPARSDLLVVTLSVIILTLVGQGLTLPWLIRRLRIGVDTEVRQEEVAARRRLVQAATRRIDELYPVWPTHHPLLDELRERYRHRSEHVEPRPDKTDEEADRDLIEHREIRRNVAEAERDALLRMRADRDIDDDVLRKLEHELDLEEQRGEA
jgi:CPA1 family monovalent cation:H+ antiporter